MITEIMSNLMSEIINISSSLLFHPLFFSAGIIQNVLVKMIIDVSSNCHNYVTNTEIMNDRVLQIAKTFTRTLRHDKLPPDVTVTKKATRNVSEGGYVGPKLGAEEKIN